jgi:hypothetical protein
MRAILTILPLLVGCVLAPAARAPALEAGDLDPAAQAFALLQPTQSLALLEDPALWLPFDGACPEVVPLDGGERWQGGCSLADGTTILGSLERHLGPGLEWVAGDGLQVLDPAGRSLLQLDGAVELIPNGELIHIDASLSACGLIQSCDDGPSTVDLAMSIFPFGGYPDRYDLAVEGLVAGPVLEATEVSGAISFDLDACATEPASGNLLLHGGTAWGFDFDGAVACDACASTSLEGLPVGPGCAAW